jgi:hypothetical protein
MEQGKESVMLRRIVVKMAEGLVVIVALAGSFVLCIGGLGFIMAGNDWISGGTFVFAFVWLALWTLVLERIARV